MGTKKEKSQGQAEMFLRRLLVLLLSSAPRKEAAVRGRKEGDPRW